MPPFEYSPFNAAPYIASVAELLAHQHDARARAAEIGGDVWGRTVQQIGQAGSQAVGDLVRYQQDAPRRQLEALQVQGATQAAQDDRLFRTALAMATKDGDLRAGVDWLKTQGGVGIAALQKLTAYVQQQKDLHDETAGELGYRIHQTGNTLNGLQSVLTEAVQRKDLSPEAASGFFQQALADPSKIPDLSRGLMAQSKTFRPLLEKTVTVKPGETVFSELTRTAIPGMSVPEKADEGAYTINGQRFDRAGNRIGAVVPTQAAPKSIESKNVLLDGKPAIVNFDPATGKHLLPDGTDVSARVKPIPPASMTINPAMVPSGDALDMAAKRYLATGDLPAMGMGQAGVAARIAVMNRAAAIDPQASLAANKAIYKADSANLTKLQTTEGTLSAFENTAGKNLDQFLALAEQIPDTGTPWLNTPVRLLNAQIVGSANMAAITAARDVALREIARVTNDPKLSGALTDSARAEVLGLSPQNATLPQIKAVAKVLKQDMANVHKGVNEQIETVKAGLGANPAAPGPVDTKGTDIKVGGFTVKVKKG